MKNKYFVLTIALLINSICIANPPIECYKKAMQDYFNNNDKGISAAVQLCSGATTNAPIECYKKAMQDYFNNNDKGISAAIQLCKGSN